MLAFLLSLLEAVVIKVLEKVEDWIGSSNRAAPASRKRRARRASEYVWWLMVLVALIALVAMVGHFGGSDRQEVTIRVITSDGKPVPVRVRLKNSMGLPAETVEHGEVIQFPNHWIREEGCVLWVSYGRYSEAVAIKHDAKQGYVVQLSVTLEDLLRAY